MNQNDEPDPRRRPCSVVAGAFCPVLVPDPFDVPHR